MTSGLRKTHLLIWLVLAMLLPVLLFFAVKNLAVFQSNSAHNSPVEISEGNVLKVQENDMVKASLFKNHIELILKSALQNPSSVVYAMDEKGNKLNVIGQLTAAGIYSFDINKLPKGIIITDTIKNEDITKFTF